jgi:creatinine amidohydrolase/Fe(II)-dependent formamide hydrolase-like protein
VEDRVKKFIWIAAGLAAVLAAPIVVSAQDAAQPRALKTYNNPPAIKPVDTVFMDDMTWSEITGAMKAGKTTVILPAGGLEATGPFITLNKHQNMLRASTDMIARKLGNALVAPVLRYVPPDEGFQRGPYVGDFNITLDAYKSVLTDVVNTLKDDGFKEIILIGDHQGAQRGMKEVASELSAKWAGGPAHVHFIPEYYDRTEVQNYIKNTLGIKEQRQPGGGFGDNYYNTAILFAVNPDAIRLKQRIEANTLTVNGVDLKPVEKTIANGKHILEMQTDKTVNAIKRAIAGG